jgi:uncharacterized protein (TIGR00369 family)
MTGQVPLIFRPLNSEFETTVRASFSKQKIMRTIGARLERVAPGEVSIGLPFREDLTQQDGFLHAGVVAAILDSACGYAAMTLVPAGARVLTVEFKANFLAPARGAAFVARASVRRAGRTLTACQADAFSEVAGQETLIATMLATIIALSPSAG